MCRKIYDLINITVLMNAKNNLQHKYTFHYIKGFSKFYPPNLFAGDVYLDDEVSSVNHI